MGVIGGEGWEAGWVSWVGDDPAITGELPEERPGDRLSRTGRGGPSQPATSGRLILTVKRGGTAGPGTPVTAYR
ncbi:hypothetical protein Van01_22590 [Micromonospora andamanensis]|uniref:Uncharacterized protein n=1 Tax=Micromonospora andamanensis TaxID=1287068 RepID=A0ABQ4HTT6_9ACTN|nr:hypothetical protein Van01_22590 [Micromonospora andamanensis]